VQTRCATTSALTAILGRSRRIVKHHRARYANAVDFTTPAAESFAYHDLLTGLPNRAAFSAHLTRTVEAASTTATSFAVVCFDLDRFKDINDTFGHAVGDDVLNAVATRLKLAAQDQFLTRNDGDDFIMIVPDPIQADLRRRLIAFQHAVGAELNIAGRTHRIRISAGVAIFPHHGSSGEIEIVSNADAALRQAKRDGPESIRFFDSERSSDQILPRKLPSALKPVPVHSNA
jgi:diguanylate cyclase (GGDEF)-like protein